MTVLDNLNQTIECASATKLYHEELKGIDFPLHSVTEIEKLPFTTKQDLRAAYPYGGLAVSKDQIIEFHTSSGTSGKPVGSFLTAQDIANGNKAIGEAWAYFGVGKDSVVLFAMSYGLFSGAALNSYAIQSLGGLVIPASIIPIEKYVELIQDLGVNTLVALPGFYYYLHETMLRYDIDPKQTSLKTMIAAGESYSEATRQQIQDMFNTKVYDHYGLAEVNTGIAYECSFQQGMHILDSYVHAEIIQDGVPAPVGGEGELVLTSLEKEASPIIRYRTGDKVTNLGIRDCQCGKRSQMISRVHGRLDSVISIKGIKVDPYELKSKIQHELGYVNDGLITFMIAKNTIHYKPTILIASEDTSVHRDIEDFLRNNTFVNFKVESAPKEFWFKNKNKAKIVEYV